MGSIVNWYFKERGTMQLKNTLNPKTASVKQRLYKAFKSYSEVTTGHGIYYVFEQTGNIVTQITWILIIFLFIILGFLFCKEAYEDWQNNPVLTTLETTGLKVEEIDFPAITLCNQQIKHYFHNVDLDSESRNIPDSRIPCWARQTDYDVVDDNNGTRKVTVKEESENTGCPDEFICLSSNDTCFYVDQAFKIDKTDLGLYCDSYDGVVFDITSMKDIQTIMDIQKIWNELNEFYVDLKIDEQELESYTSPYGISLRMNDTLGNCIAVNIKRTISFIRKKCSETLSLACISRKSCIAAVGMAQSLSWGYPCQITELSPTNQLILPQRIYHIQKYNSLIREEIDKFFRNLDQMKAFDELFQLLWFDKMPCFEVIEPIEKEEEVKGIQLSKRNCFFHDEKELKYFKDYTRNNCLFECDLEKGRRKTNCTPWYFPVLDKDINICDPWKTKAFIKAMDLDELICDCKSDCKETIYSTSFTSVPFRDCNYLNLDMSYLCDFESTDPPHIFAWDILNDESYNLIEKKYTSPLRDIDSSIQLDDFIKSSTEYNAYDKDIAILNFYFDKSAVLQYKRQRKLTTIKFLGQIGGILGLMLGFSIISFIELAYWVLYKFIFANVFYSCE
ncbi:uncharacterized protein [Lepeophtheirus salmonis]|uniref:uncharacterized protein n=1 Tax=Lepeophtheirus salmonis TaxID=72036 RepID=UPI003AF40328